MVASLEQDFRCDVATNSAIDEIFEFHTQMFSYIAQDNMKRERFGNLPWRQFPIRGMLGENTGNAIVQRVARAKSKRRAMLRT